MTDNHFHWQEPEDPKPPKSVALATRSKPRIPKDIEKAIIADRAKGLGIVAIADKYNVSRRSVDRIWAAFKKATDGIADPDDTPERFHHTMRRKAIAAVHAGLDTTDDPYRRAGIGVKVMEGIGEFKSGQVTVNINNVVAQTPAQFRERYLGIEDEAK